MISGNSIGLMLLTVAAVLVGLSHGLYGRSLWEPSLTRSTSRSNSEVCEGRIPLGGFCGQAIRFCCGMTKCRAFNIFTRSFSHCRTNSYHEACVCVLPEEERDDYGMPWVHPTPHVPWNPCAGRIRQGEICGGNNAYKCCGDMVCATYRLHPCPTWSLMKDCICVPRMTTSWA